MKGKIVWMVRDHDEKYYTILEREPEIWEFEEIKKIVYFEVE